MIEIILWPKLHRLSWVHYIYKWYQYWCSENSSYSWVPWASDLEKGLVIPQPCQLLQQIYSWLCWHCYNPYGSDWIIFWMGVDRGWVVLIWPIEGSFSICPGTGRIGPHQECFICHWDWCLQCHNWFSTFGRLRFQTAANCLLLQKAFFCIT